MKRAGSRISSRFLLSLTLLAGFFVAAPIEEAAANNIVSAACQIGSSSSCPAQSPQEIVNLYGTTTNGSYWVNINGIATETFLALDPAYPDGGGWFLGIKGTKSGGSFHYASTNWTSQGTTLNPSSLSNDVTTEAKFNAYNYLPTTKVVAVFRDRNSYNFSSAGTGALGVTPFGGHTWKEDISSQTMFTRFTTTQHIVNATGLTTRYELYRESNSSNANLVFPYMTGFSRYGFNNSTGKQYRWGIAFNNENDEPRFDSADVVSGIGLAANSAAGIISYSDGFAYGLNGGTGANNPGTSEYPSGFQIWGKMAAPSLATPGSLSISNLGSGSIRINFAAASGATEYAVQYKSAGSNWSSGTTVRLTNPSATPSATLNGIATGSYDFRVFSRATNNSSSGNSFLLAQSVDATTPTISNIAITSSPGGDSIYGAGETLTATVNWSETVTVTGSPRIPIQGLSGKHLTYFSGSGTTSTAFSYRVTSGDLDRDGVSISLNTLELNGGTITDQSLNTASLAHGAIAPSLSSQVDGTPPSSPTLQATLNGASIDLTYGETLSSNAPATSTFIVSVNGVTNPVTAISVTANSLRLTLTFSVISGATVTLAYSEPSTANDLNAVQDEAGNDAPSFSATSVTNLSTSSTNTTVTLALNPSSSTAIYRAVTTIRATASTSGRVDFFHEGKIIPNCRNVLVSGNLANCFWRPSKHAYANLTVRLKPSGPGFINATSEPLRLFVVRRTGAR